MGLDITAHRGLTPVGKFDPDSDEEQEISLFDNTDFPGRMAGLDPNAIYEAKDSVGFNAGSYSGYNIWRDQLAKIAGYPSASYVWKSKAKYTPFEELINFSDCEGTIGPIVAAKLAKDFADFDETASLSGDYFYAKYKEWRNAFEMAADNGAVEFH